MLTQEKILQAMDCKTAEELVTFASKDGFNLSVEEAEAYLAEFADYELSAEELYSISGFTQACRDCRNNRLCTGDGTCSGGRYRYTRQELEEAVA